MHTRDDGVGTAVCGVRAQCVLVKNGEERWYWMPELTDVIFMRHTCAASQNVHLSSLFVSPACSEPVGGTAELVT